MNHMHGNHTEGPALIERYLQGKLAPDEQAAFEEAYLSDPALLEQVELAERLQQGMVDLDRAEGIRRRGMASWTTWLSSPRYAAAASLLLVVSLVFSVAVYRENLSLRGTAGSLVSSPQARLEPLLSVRGAGGNSIEAPAADELVVLLIDPGFFDYESFEVTVARLLPDSFEVVWEAEGLEPGYQDYLAVTVPGDRLLPGDYEVTVAGIDALGAMEIVSRVPMTVEPPNEP